MAGDSDRGGRSQVPRTSKPKVLYCALQRAYHRHAMPEQLARQLDRCADVRSLADCALHRGLDLSAAIAGNIQLMNWNTGYLEIKAQQGFDEEFLRFFKRVKIEDGSACARALRKHDAIIIEDIAADPEFAPCLEIARRAGVRAVQSTPLTSSSGALVGILSTHFAVPHRPTDLQMRGLQETARLMANAIIDLQAHTGVWSPLKSLRLIEESRTAIGRADLVLARGAFY